MRNRNRWLLWTGSALSALIAIVLALIAFDRYHRFDQQIWKAVANSRDRDNPRYRMLADLRVNYIRKGMPAAEVIALLGEPDIEKSTDVYGYNVGMQSGFRMDFDSFNIYFDSGGRVTHTGMQQH